MLEKDTNSGLNSLHYRNQQVLIAQPVPAGFPQARLHHPGELSLRQRRRRRSSSTPTISWCGRRPIGSGEAARRSRVLLRADRRRAHRPAERHARVLSGAGPRYRSNPIAGKRTSISTRRWRRLELSCDRTGSAIACSFFWASGDKNPRDGTARGFDAILDNSNFAGGFFSFWNREGIRLTGYRRRAW